MVGPIKEYTQRFGSPSIEVGGRRASAEDFGGQVAQELTGLGREVQNTALIVDRYEQETQVADAQIKMIQAETYATERLKVLQTEAKPGTPIAEQMRAEMNDYMGSLAGNYDRKGARKYVDIYGAGLTQKFVQQAVRFDVDLAVQDKFAKRDQIVEANKRLALADPSTYSDIKKQLTFEADGGIGVWGVPDPTNPRVVEASNKQVRKGINDIAWSAAMGAIQNPGMRSTFAGIASQLNPGQTGIVDALIKREGGFVADDAGRGPTKFGINQQANPDIDVSKLTEAQAAKLYTDRYWNKYGIGDLPANTQAIVMDGVVNHRAVFAQQLAEAARAGATVDQLAQMRVAEYERLIASNPAKYAGFRESWMKRVADTAAQTGGQMTHDGFPARQNADGSYSTEVSITVTDPRLNGGKPTNIPSLWGGREVDENTAVTNALAAGKEYKSYSSIDQAVSAAKARSESGGAGAPAEISTKIDNAPEWYNDLTAEQQVSFLRMAEQQSKRERAIGDSARRKTMQDHEAYIAQTGQLPPNPLPDNTFTDPAERDTYKAMLSAGQIVSEVMSAPVTKQKELLEKLVPTYAPETAAPGVYDKQVQIAQNAQRLLESAMKQRQKDPILFAQQHKFSLDNPITPIQQFDLDNVIPALTQRIPQAEAVARQYGQPLKPLMDAEAQAMAQTVGRMNTTDKMNYLKGLSGSLTMGQYNSVVNQVWKDNNPVQFVGKLMTNEGAVQNGVKASRVAEVVLIGQQALEYKPAGAGGEAERGFKGVMPNFADVRQAVGEHLKGVKIPEAAVGNISEVVMAHYVGSMLGKGVSKNFELKDNSATFEDSLNTVLGNTSTVGTEKVLRPFGMDDSQFQQRVRDRVRAIDPSLRGYGLTIRDGENAIYDVTTGNQIRFQINVNSDVPISAVSPPTKAAAPNQVYPTTQSLARYPWERQ